MRRTVRRTLGLALAGAIAAMAATRAPAWGADGPGYQVLADLAVMDQGRVKPLSTLAIERVKTVYSRQQITLTDPATKKETRWGPVAALLDWSARPEYWDKQPFLLVRYVPLKQLLFREAIRAQLLALAAREGTPPSEAEAFKSLAAKEAISAEELTSLFGLKSLKDEDRKALDRLIQKISADSKYLSPEDVESAVVTVDGQTMPFLSWFNRLVTKQRRLSREAMGGNAKLPMVEQMALELGQRMYLYRSPHAREHPEHAAISMTVVPRPSNEAYLKFTAEAYQKATKSQGEGLTALELDAATALADHYRHLQSKDRALPGEGNKEFDARFATWLRDNADWVPLDVILESDPEVLAGAGFPADKVSAFRAAFQGLIEAERATPGQIPPAVARAVVNTARELGSSLGHYPSPTEMARETHFNRFAPFYWAPFAYGLALACLLVSLGTTSGARTLAGRIGELFYWGGLASFLVGIGLEIYGFYLRVRISGWAPVTNMYETVIWVALVTSILGLVLELIGRKKYPALAASAVAFLATLLATNVPLLDPDIPTLPAVLRSNYWLTIHVLTIVSSYAAFALALGLGLIAIGFYLTASYRRSPGYVELAAPLLPGLPLLAAGVAGIYGSYHGWFPSFVGEEAGFYASTVLAAIGGMLSVVGLYGVVGELSNRRPLVAAVLGVVLLIPGTIGIAADQLEIGPRWASETLAAYGSWAMALVGLSWIVLALFGVLAQMTLGAAMKRAGADDGAGEGDEGTEEEDAPVTSGSAGTPPGGDSGGGVATLARPTVAEIRARMALAAQPTLDARTLSMQATAARIKPLANFVYRAMQVGVLLIAAGTILGGVWADYSWGRFWGWDPKEVWALITLLVYLVPLHGRFAGWVNTFGLIVASVVCFLSVLMAWYGVNFVLGVGLHSYGFVEGGGQWTVLTCTLAVMAIVGGAAWRRWLASRKVPVAA